MILQKIIKVSVTNRNRNRYLSLGYNVSKKFICIKIEHLPIKSHMMISYRCDNCYKAKKSTYANFKKRNIQYCQTCSVKLAMKSRDNAYIIEANKLRSGNKHWNWNSEKPNFMLYKYRVQSATRSTYQKYKNSINPNNLKRTRSGIKGGYQLDHKISIKEGYRNQVPIKTIASKENLQMLSWEQNLKKGSKSLVN